MKTFKYIQKTWHSMAPDFEKHPNYTPWLVWLNRYGAEGFEVVAIVHVDISGKHVIFKIEELDEKVQDNPDNQA